MLKYSRANETRVSQGKCPVEELVLLSENAVEVAGPGFQPCREPVGNMSCIERVGPSPRIAATEVACGVVWPTAQGDSDLTKIPRNLKLNINKLKMQDIDAKFKENINSELNILDVQNSDAENKWKHITNVISKTSEKLLKADKMKTRKYNMKIQELSMKQKKLGNKINSCISATQRRKLRKERNRVIKEIQNILRSEKKEIELQKIEDIEKMNNDSNKMYATV